MGRIQEAIGRQKKSRDDKSARPKQSNVVEAPDVNGSPNRVVQQHPVFESLHRKATIHVLDSDSLNDNRVTTDQQELSVRSAYKMLRTRVLQRMRTNGWTSLAISSARSNAGKTITAINMAMSIAHDPNQRVILVDLDLRRPSISNYLDIEPRYDVVDYILNGVSIEKVVVRTEVERLLIIPAKHSQEYSSELLSSNKMVRLAKMLQQGTGNTIVIYDLPPMLDADDMLAFSPYFDALLFVIAECETRRADLQQAQDLVEELEVIGVVLNKSGDNSPAYY